MRTCAPLGAAARFRSSAGIGSGTRHADRVSAPRAAARRVDDRRSQLEAAQILIAPPDTGERVGGGSRADDRRSQPEAAQIRIAPPDTCERVGGLVVLDERVADAGLLPSGED